MNGFLDALANAELSLLGILGEPYGYLSVHAGAAGEETQRDAAPAFEFDESHYRQAAG
jgi:hypothetical protein